MARSARAFRSVENGPRQIFEMERTRRLRPNIGRIHRRRRSRGGDRRFDLRPSASARCGRKRGAQNQCIGRSRGGFTTKIHVLVDALGNPLHLHLTAGNVNDVSEAPRLVQAAQGTYFIADKGYDSQAVVAAIEAKDMIAVIPSPADRSRRRKIDSHVYKERHLVENFFCRLKHYRRAATRFDKTAANFLGFVLLAAIRIWLA